MQKRTFRYTTWIKILVSGIWAALFGLLLQRDYFIAPLDSREQAILQLAESEDFFSIFFRNAKIGYAVYRFTQNSDRSWQLHQDATMNLNIGSIVQKTDLSLIATLAKDQTLKTFTFKFRSPFYHMTAEGFVEDHNIHYQLDTGTSVISDQLHLSSPPLLASSRRSYLLSDNLKVGEKRKIPWFDPMSMTAKESVVEYRGLDSVLINGRVHRLHQFTENFGGARVHSWLDDKGEVVKEESPAGFVFLKEPKFKALALSSDPGEEILSAVAVKYSGPPPDPGKETQSYRLNISNPETYDLSGGRQFLAQSVLTVNRVITPGTASGRGCENAEDDLLPTPYVQSGNSQIRNLAEDLTKGLTDPNMKVRNIAQWVYENLEKRPVLGLPDALSTLQTKKGDCNEHAALFAALARAAGLPTRIASGVTFYRQGFYYHAWNEVCVDDNLLSVDTTTNQMPADVTHIRFVYGELQEQVRITGLLGNLAIEVLP